jgi:hypothetical protein
MNFDFTKVPFSEEAIQDAKDIVKVYEAALKIFAAAKRNVENFKVTQALADGMDILNTVIEQYENVEGILDRFEDTDDGIEKALVGVEQSTILTRAAGLFDNLHKGDEAETEVSL